MEQVGIAWKCWRMPHESLLLRNDYDRKIDYDWPY